MGDKTEIFPIRFSEEELRYLKQIAQRKNLPVAAVIRDLLFSKKKYSPDSLTKGEFLVESRASIQAMKKDFKKLVNELIDGFEQYKKFRFNDPQLVDAVYNKLSEIQSMLNGYGRIFGDIETRVSSRLEEQARRAKLDEARDEQDSKLEFKVKYSNMEKTMLVGRLKEDAHTYTTKANSTTKIGFTLTCTKTRKGFDKNTFYDISYWYDEKLLPLLKKGEQVTVVGDLDLTIGQSDDGKAYINAYVIADSIALKVED